MSKLSIHRNKKPKRSPWENWAIIYKLEIGYTVSFIRGKKQPGASLEGTVTACLSTPVSWPRLPASTGRLRHGHGSFLYLFHGLLTLRTTWWLVYVGSLFALWMPTDTYPNKGDWKQARVWAIYEVTTWTRIIPVRTSLLQEKQHTKN